MDKNSVETILTIIIVFLGSFLILSMINDGMNIFMLLGALACTYIFVHYWEKKFLAKHQSEIKQGEKG